MTKTDTTDEGPPCPLGCRPPRCDYPEDCPQDASEIAHDRDAMTKTDTTDEGWPVGHSATSGHEPPELHAMSRAPATYPQLRAAMSTVIAQRDEWQRRAEHAERVATVYREALLSIASFE